MRLLDYVTRDALRYYDTAKLRNNSYQKCVSPCKCCHHTPPLRILDTTIIQYSTQDYEAEISRSLDEYLVLEFSRIQLVEMDYEI